MGVVRAGQGRAAKEPPPSGNPGRESSKTRGGLSATVLPAESSASAGRGLTYQRPLERVWGEKSGGNVRLMGTIVIKIRRKLGDDADSPTYDHDAPIPNDGPMHDWSVAKRYRRFP